MIVVAVAVVYVVIGAFLAGYCMGKMDESMWWILPYFLCIVWPVLIVVAVAWLPFVAGFHLAER